MAICAERGVVPYLRDFAVIFDLLPAPLAVDFFSFDFPFAEGAAWDAIKAAIAPAALIRPKP